MLYWRTHFRNEILVNRLFIKWKWTYILDFGPWRWGALNMGFVNKTTFKNARATFFSKQMGHALIFDRVLILFLGVAQGSRAPTLMLQFYSRGRRWRYKIHFKIFQNIFNVFLIENHRRHQSMRSFIVDHCQKCYPLPRWVLQAALCPSIDSRLRLDLPQCKICLVQRRRHQRHYHHSPSKVQGSNTAGEFECTNAIW